MKKKAIAIAALACMCLMSGCNSDIEQELAGDVVTEETSDTASTGDGMSDNIKKPEDYVANLEYADNRIEISEYKKLYDTDIQALTTGEHSNIDFVNCYFRPIDEMEEVGIYNLEASTLGVEESIGYIKDLLKSEGCEDIDLEAELRDVRGQVGGIPGENEEWPAVYDIYDKLTEGYGFLIDSKEFYVQMWGFGYRQVSNGDITRYLGLDSLPSRDCFGSNTDDNIIETYAFKDAKDMEWELTAEVDKVKFVYTKLEYPDEEYMVNIYPCWYFSGKNKSNEEYLYMCVNALTGDVYYYSSHNKY